MVKILSLCTFLMGAQFSVMGTEKLPSQYQIVYGDLAAPIKITEYFSLSCPNCIKSFQKDFKTIQDKYIKTHQVYWAFHLNPADLLTLQALVCLEKLSPQEKITFFEFVIANLDNADLIKGSDVMKVGMQALGKPAPNLDDIDELKSNPIFQLAYRYLKQPGIVQELPTVEINGTVYDEFPHIKFIEKKINTLKPTKVNK